MSTQTTKSVDSALTQLPSTVPVAAMPLISPSALLQAHLVQNPPTRPSARSPSQPQPIDLNTSSLTHCNGSSVVKIGATTIVCGLRAEILPVSEIPSYDTRTAPTTRGADNDNPVTLSPEEHTPISLYNLVVPNLELSTGCSALHPANAAPGIQAQSLSQRLYTLLLTSRIIDPADLEIVYTPPPETDAELDPDDPAYIARVPEIKAYWVLYVDMTCLSHGGVASVFDAAWLSLLAALADTVLPHARWDADDKIILCDPRVDRGRRLHVMGAPVPLSFGVFVGDRDPTASEDERPTWTLVDPDAFEEQCCDETGCVVVDLSGREGGEIVRLEKSGGTVVDGDAIRQLLGPAEERWNEWRTVLHASSARSRGS